MIYLFKGLIYCFLFIVVVYALRDQIYILTPLIVVSIIPLILLRQIELRYYLNKRVQGGRRGYIYAFSDIGQLIPTIKIGRETDKGSRMRSHNTAAPFGTIVWCNFWVGDSVYAEAYLHERYRWMRVSRNNEWFYVINPLILIDLILLGWFSKR